MSSQTEGVCVPEPPEILDAGEAAELLGVHLTARVDLRPVPHSWPPRIRRQELEAFLAARRVPPGELGGRCRRSR